MSKHITDWMDMPDTAYLFELEPDEMIIKESELMLIRTALEESLYREAHSKVEVDHKAIYSRALRIIDHINETSDKY